MPTLWAKRLSEGLRTIPGVKLIYPTEINEVFVSMPQTLVTELQLAGASFYPWVLSGTTAQCRGPID